MEDNMLYYILVFPTILNTILLIVMAFVMYKLLVIAGELTFKIGKFVDRGEEEFFATTNAFRQVATTAAGLLEKITQVIDRYAFAYSVKKKDSGSDKLSQIITGVGVGFTIFKFITKFFKKDKDKE